MIFPEIIAYLLTLKYPGSESERMNWVCYRSAVQLIIPLMPPGTTISYTAQPLHGSFAWLYFSTRIGTDMVPNSFIGTIHQYGTTPFTGLVTQRMRDDPMEFLLLVTEQEPIHTSVTNLSPLAQRLESYGDLIVIPTPHDLRVVIDALRRMHTSEESER
ncbi:unnamed protein product, partial [marine sediment metagenome]